MVNSAWRCSASFHDNPPLLPIPLSMPSAVCFFSSGPSKRCARVYAQLPGSRSPPSRPCHPAALSPHLRCQHLCCSRFPPGRPLDASGPLAWCALLLKPLRHRPHRRSARHRFLQLTHTRHGGDPRSNPRALILLALAVFYLVVYLHEAPPQRMSMRPVGRIALNSVGAVSLRPQLTIEMKFLFPWSLVRWGGLVRALLHRPVRPQSLVRNRLHRN